MTNQLYQLSVEKKTASGAIWNACTLEVLADGRYRFAFSYDAPKRLNGNCDDESMFRNYAPKPW